MSDDTRRSASSNRPGPTAYGSCPTCGTRTKGVHIAGTVYDFQCDDCVGETDAGFDSFITRLLGRDS